MNHSILLSEEFQKDFENTLRKINEKHNLALHCGFISYGDEEITISLDCNTSPN